MLRVRSRARCTPLARLRPGRQALRWLPGTGDLRWTTRGMRIQLQAKQVAFRARQGGGGAAARDVSLPPAYSAAQAQMSTRSALGRVGVGGRVLRA